MPLLMASNRLRSSSASFATLTGYRSPEFLSNGDFNGDAMTKAKRSTGFQKAIYYVRVYKQGAHLVDIPIDIPVHTNPKHTESKAIATTLIIFETIRNPNILSTLKRALKTMPRSSVELIRDFAKEHQLDHPDMEVTATLKASKGSCKRMRVYSHEPAGVKAEKADLDIACAVAAAN